MLHLAPDSDPLIPETRSCAASHVTYNHPGCQGRRQHSSPGRRNTAAQLPPAAVDFAVDLKTAFGVSVCHEARKHKNTNISWQAELYHVALSHWRQWQHHAKPPAQDIGDQTRPHRAAVASVPAGLCRQMKIRRCRGGDTVVVRRSLTAAARPRPPN